MQLSGNSIFNLCSPHVAETIKTHDWLRDPKTGYPLPMISPFLETKTIINGKSCGLSVASYDLRIAHDLTLPPHPGFVMGDALSASVGDDRTIHEIMRTMWRALSGLGANFQIAHTIESVAMPLDVSGQICDKSTYARLGLSCFNTFFDPGFIGNCTLELVNLSPKLIIIRAGDPICQMVFNRLDRPVPKGYDGKYQNQPKQPVPAILEQVPPDMQGTGLDWTT